MSALHDLIMALPEGATLEIRRGEEEDSVVVDFDITYRGQGITLGTAVVLERSLSTYRDNAHFEIDEKARAILCDPRFAAVPA